MFIPIVSGTKRSTKAGTRMAREGDTGVSDQKQLMTRGCKTQYGQH